MPQWARQHPQLDHLRNACNRHSHRRFLHDLEAGRGRRNTSVLSIGAAKLTTIGVMVNRVTSVNSTKYARSDEVMEQRRDITAWNWQADRRRARRRRRALAPCDRRREGTAS